MARSFRVFHLDAKDVWQEDIRGSAANRYDPVLPFTERHHTFACHRPGGTFQYGPPAL